MCYESCATRWTMLEGVLSVCRYVFSSFSLFNILVVPTVSLALPLSLLACSRFLLLPGWGYAYRERPANNEAECAVISATTWDWTTWQANNGKCYAINGPFSNGFIRPEAMWNVFHDAQIDNACNLGPGNCQLVYFVGRNCYGEPRLDLPASLSINPLTPLLLLRSLRLERSMQRLPKFTDSPFFLWYVSVLLAPRCLLPR